MFAEHGLSSIYVKELQSKFINENIKARSQSYEESFDEIV